MQIQHEQFSYKLNDQDHTATLISYNGHPFCNNDVTIPRSIKYQEQDYLIKIIGESSFKEKNVKNVKIDENSCIETIETNAFYNSNIEKIFLPRSVNRIKDGAFNFCKKLSNVEFAEDSDLHHIGQNAFSYTIFETINIPSKVEFMANNCFSFNLKLKKITISPDNKHFICSNNMVLYKMNLESDEYELFFGFSEIDHLKIPSTIKIIGKYSFYNHSNLRSIEFEPNSKLILIDAYAFSKTSISSIKIPSHVQQIGCYAFENCEQLKTIEFEDNSELSFIECSAFSSSQISTIKIPSHVQQIKSWAFNECKMLTRIDFDENSELNYIGNYAFRNSSLSTIKIPRHVRKINTYSFSSCDRLKTIEFYDNSELLEIDSKAFVDSAIESFKIPPHLSIINDALAYCPNLTSITVSPENKLFKCTKDGLLLYKPIGEEGDHKIILNACKNIVRVTIPSYVNEISVYAFKECKKLNYFEIPNDSKLMCIESNFRFEILPETIIIPSKLIKYFSFIPDIEKVTQIVINDEEIDIPKNSFFAMPNIQKVSFPNAQHITIDEMNGNFEIIVDINATIDNRESIEQKHKISPIEKELLKDVSFPSENDLIKFLRQSRTSLLRQINNQV